MAASDRVDMRVEFDWEFIGAAELDPETDWPLVPEGLEGPGVYRLRSGRRDSGIAFDCWYVGRTMRDVGGRVIRHASEDYDEVKRSLKQFKANMREDDGWVEIDRAANITVNGVAALRMTPPPDRNSDPDEWEAVELVFNLIEAAGLAANLEYAGRSSKK